MRVVAIFLLLLVLSPGLGLGKEFVEVVVGLRADLPRELRNIVGLEAEIQYSSPELELEDFKFYEDGWWVEENDLSVLECQRLRNNSAFPLDIDKEMRSFIFIAISPVFRSLHLGEDIFRLRFIDDKNLPKAKIVLRWASICLGATLEMSDFEKPLEILEIKGDLKYLPQLALAVDSKSLCATWGKIKKQ